MADRLYLSYWLRGFSTMNMARHFEKLLANFPFSPDNPANTALRVQHIDSNEPPVVEHVFADPLDIVEVGNVIRPGISTDCCEIGRASCRERV